MQVPLPPLQAKGAARALLPVDVRRIGDVLGLELEAIADRFGAEAWELRAWMRTGAAMPEQWRGAALELAVEAKRLRPLYLSADVRRLREIAGHTQSEMAAALDVNRHTVNQWETGKRLPTGQRVLALRSFERKLLENPPNPGVRECPKCGRTYPRLDRYFHLNASSPDGLHSQCRGCRSGTGEQYWLRKYGSIF
jgi:transcriptional regulator with XRE-family HTH domain